MAYKASMQERFHRKFNSRIRTDGNTLIRSTGIASNLESLYLFNGEDRARPAVIPNLKQDKHHIDMTWNGDGYLLGDGGVKFADNGNAVTNTSGTVRDIDTTWSTSKQGKSRVFVANLEWKAQSTAQCYVLMTSGFQFFRSTSGTVFTISIENVSTHRITWTIDTTAFRDGDPVTIVAMADMRDGNNTSSCFLNGVDLGVGTVSGTPFTGAQSQPLSTSNYFGRATPWPDYYGFDGKVGLFGHSFEFPSNIPPSLADLKALSIDPYRVLLNTQRSKIDLPDILLPVAADWEIEFEARCGFLPNNDNMVPILTASDYAPNTTKCLNLQAAGNQAYATIPQWTRQYGAGATWSVEVEFEVTELSGTIQVLSTSSSTITSFLRLDVDGSIGVRNSNTMVLVSPAGAIQLYKRYKLKISREDDTLAKLYIDDMVTPIATCPIGDIPTTNTDQIARYSTTIIRPTFVLYSLKFVNSVGTGNTPNFYSAEWNSSSIPAGDFATAWPSVGNTHDITIMNRTVEIDPYFTKTPLMTGIFTNSAGQLVWCEGVNNYLTGGFAMAMQWSGNSTRYLGLSTSWTGAAASVWSIETEFMVYENNTGSGVWGFSPFSNNASGMVACTVSSDQTTFDLIAKNTAGTTVNTVTGIPFVVGKWYKIKVESTNADWVVTVDNVERSRVANTTATAAINYILHATITPVVRFACRSLVTTGGTYAATWNTSVTTGKGSIWTSTNGLRTLSPYGTVSDAYFWYDMYRRRLISQSEAIIPQERHIYKITKTGSTFTVSRDGTQAVVVAWTQSRDMYINRIGNASTNGTEYGQRVHLYSLRVGTETWTPDATTLVSSVNSGRNAVVSGVSFIDIPNSYIYCPTNGLTYANFDAIPTAVVNLTNVVFEISGFVRDIASVRLNQTPATSVTVKATAGQEFAGKIYDDAVATAMFCNAGAGLVGLSAAPATGRTLIINDVILTSNQTSSSGLMSGVVGTTSSATGTNLTMTNVGVLSHYGLAKAIDYSGATSVVTLNNVIAVGAGCSGAAIVTANKLTSVNTHPTATNATAIAGTPNLTASIAIKPSQSTSPAAAGTYNNVATNDVSGTYGLFTSLNDFVDAEYGDYRLKSDVGLYKSGIGAFSPTYSSPSFVADVDQEAFYKGDVFGGGMYFDYHPITVVDPAATFSSVNVSTSAFATKTFDYSQFSSTQASASQFNQIDISKSGFASSGTITSTFASKEIHRPAWTSTGSIAATFAAIEIHKPSFASTGTITASFATKGIDKPTFVSTQASVSSFASKECQFSQFSSSNVATASFASKEVSKLGFSSTNTSFSEFVIQDGSVSFTSTNVSNSNFGSKELQTSDISSINSFVSTVQTKTIKKAVNTSSNVIVTSVQAKTIDKTQVTSVNVVGTSVQVKTIKKASYDTSGTITSAFSAAKTAKVSVTSGNVVGSTFNNNLKAKSQLNSSNDVAASFNSLKLCYPSFYSSNTGESVFVQAVTFDVGFESTGISFSGFNWEDVMRDQLIAYTNMEGFWCSGFQIDGYQAQFEILEGYA